MCAELSPLFSINGWAALEEMILNHDQNYHGGFTGTSESFLNVVNHPSSSQLERPEHEQLRSSTGGGGCNISNDPITMVKKLNHNASERDRRKKINFLYSSLRCLLPEADQMKNLSNPATISRVLRYIPELQQQVEGLTRKKGELLSKMGGEDDELEQKKMRSATWSSLSAVSASRLNEREVVIHISTNNVHPINRLSVILLVLEEDGLQLLSASSSESLDGRMFFNLHLQVERTYKLEPEDLNEKLLSVLHERKEEFLSSNLG